MDAIGVGASRLFEKKMAQERSLRLATSRPARAGGGGRNSAAPSGHGDAEIGICAADLRRLRARRLARPHHRIGQRTSVEPKPVWPAGGADQFDRHRIGRAHA